MKRIKEKKFGSILPWWQPYIFIFPFFAVYLIFQIFPIFYSFSVSLTKWNGFTEKVFVGFNNYKTLISDPRFYIAFMNTLKFMLIPIPILIIGGLLLASLMTSPFVKGKRLYQICTFLPFLLSSVASGFLFGFLFDAKIGTINKLLLSLNLIQPGELNWLSSPQLAPIVVMIIIIWRNFGFYMVLMIAGISNIPSELNDAAMVDGANFIQIFFRITIPQMRNMITFVVLQGVIHGFQLIEEPMTLLTGVITGGSPVLAGGPERSALTMMWYMYDNAFGTNINFGYATSIAFGVFFIIAVTSLLLFRILSRREDDVS